MGKKRRREKQEALVLPVQSAPAEPLPPPLDKDRPSVVPLIKAIESLRAARLIAFYSDPMEPPWLRGPRRGAQSHGGRRAP
jgi:hypothetical protein